MSQPAAVSVLAMSSPSAPDARRRGRGRRLLLVVGLAAVAILPPLAYPSILSSHEARFALLGRDVLARGAWLPALQGKVYRNKPPLFPWAIAATSSLHGRVTPSSALVPVAGGALVAVASAFLLGDSLFGWRAGVWAGLMLPTTLGFFGHTRMVLPDMMMVGFSTLSCYAAWAALAGPPSGTARMCFYVALGLACAAKGPVGLVSLLTAGVWLWSEGGALALRRLWTAGGIAVFAIMTFAWLAPFFTVHEPAQPIPWSGVFSYLGAPEPVTLAGQLVRAAMGLLPLAVALPFAVSAALRKWGDSRVRFALLTFAVPLIVVLLSHTQRRRYLLLVYPGASLLVAWWADAHARRGSVAPRWLAGLTFAAAAAVAAAPLWMRPSPRVFVPGYSLDSLPLLAGLVLLTVAIIAGARTGRPAVMVYGTTAAMMLLLTYGSWLHARWRAETRDVPRLARLVAQHAEQTTPGVAGSSGIHLELDFYLGRDTILLPTVDDVVAHLRRPEHPVVVIDHHTWTRARAAMSARTAVLEHLRVSGKELEIVRAL
jgi:4-amino-4-deoxy-L-arabinose transferase-like glycosyltransferase